MKLEKLILVNWGALESKEYLMSNMVILTGMSGGGKSTMLDALQTVMTAAYGNISSYNPAQRAQDQNARGGMTKRTLPSYIVGAEDNLYARPQGAHGYVAAVFKPDEDGQGKEFTAVIGCAARVERSGILKKAELERLVLLIVDEAGLEFSDFAQFNDGDLTVVEADKIERELMKKYPKVMCLRDGKREYLSQLYGRFRGLQRSVPFPEAEAAAKAWVQTIADKKIGSVDTLVKDHILDHNPEHLADQIQSISQMMRQIYNLLQEGQRIEDSVSRLKTLIAHSDEVTSAYEESVQLQLLNAKKAVKESARQIEASHQRIADLERSHEEALKDVERTKAQQGSNQDAQVSVKAQLAGIPGSGRKKELQKQQNEGAVMASSAIEALIKGLAAADAITTFAKFLQVQDFPDECSDLKQAVTGLSAKLSGASATRIESLRTELASLLPVEEFNLDQLSELSTRLKKHAEVFDSLFEALKGTSEGVSAAILTELALIKSRLLEAQKEERQLAESKRGLAVGGSNVPPFAREGRRQIEEQYPQANPQFLCDLIEPRNEDWQLAVEAYMGTSRFSLIVNEAFERDATRLAKSARLGIRVIQGAKCLKQAPHAQVHAESIVHELETHHPIAKAYLRDQFGSVEKVYSEEALRFVNRGTMIDGRAAGGRTTYVNDLENFEPVFGAAQRKKAFERAIRNHELAEAALKVLQRQETDLRLLLGKLEALRSPDFSSLDSLETAALSFEDARVELGNLDLTGVEELEAREKSLAEEGARLIQLAHEKTGDLAKCAFELEGKRRAVQGLQLTLAENQGIEDKQLDQLRVLCEVNPALSYTDMVELVEVILAKRPNEHKSEDASAARNRAITRILPVQQALMAYNQNAHQNERLEGTDFSNASEEADPITQYYGPVVMLRRRAQEQRTVFETVGLLKNIEELAKANESFQNVFTQQFCFNILNAVESGVRTLKALDNELKKIKFGTDRFKIDWSEWVPEFKEYHDFFRAAYDLAQNSEGGNLFSEPSLSPQMCVIRDRLQQLLLSPDQDHAHRELHRIADYRNYRRYEIWKESDSGSKVPLSTWGTGSGGQLETPSYIIRAAVLTNRLKHFDKGAKLKMLVNDEAFSQMDETRTRDVIKFLRDYLGFQIICAMPTKHVGPLKPEFTREWSFSRTAAADNGEVNFVSEPDGKELKADQLSELWDRRRAQVREQAQLSFEVEEAEVAAKTASAKDTSGAPQTPSAEQAVA